MEVISTKVYYTKSIIISSCISLIFYNSTNSYYDEVLVAIVCCSLVLVLSNLFLFFYTKNNFHLLFFPTLLLTWIYFQRPFISDSEIWYNSRVIPSKYLLDIVLFPALGIGALFIGYYLSFRKMNIKPFSDPNLKVSNNYISSLIYIFILSGILNRFLEFNFPEVFENSGQLLFILKQSGTSVIALTTIYYLRNGRNILLFILVVLFSFMEYVLCLMSTLFTQIIVLFGGGFLMYILERKKIPYKALLIFLILNIPVYANRFQHRFNEEVEQSSTNFSLALVKGQEIFLDNIENFDYENLFQKENKNLKENEIDRMEQVSYLGQTVFKHEIVGWSYHLGSTFWWLPLVPIPRILYPEKPENLMATRVAEEYGLKNPETGGAMNFPMLVEYYINFGFWGIIIFSFFQGAFYKWTLKKICYGNGDLNLLILMSLILQLMKIEANITLVFGQIIQILIFWWFILYFFNLNNLKRSTYSFSS